MFEMQTRSSATANRKPICDFLLVINSNYRATFPSYCWLYTV